jgi:C1A family cysteine protease
MTETISASHGFYGWQPDLPDYRDLRYAVHRMAVEAPRALPEKVDLRGSSMPAPYDQGQLGSCTANAIAGAFEYEHIRLKLGKLMPSRLFIYYGERAMEGSIKSDAGAEIRDGIKVVASKGTPDEKLWPYDIAKFAQKPPADAFKDALKHKAVAYFRVDHLKLEELLGCLAGGFPIVFGFTVYESFESEEVAKTGVLQMPKHGEHVQGGHAVLAVGYDQKTERVLVRNSWGSTWGQKGYFTMPYQYLTNGDLADDFWTIRVVS